MNRSRFALPLLVFFVVSSMACTGASAAPPADRLFPVDTVGFLSIQDTEDFRAKFDRTQIGKLAEDDALKPFVDQVRSRLDERFGDLEERLGVKLEDLTAVAGGETATGVVARAGQRAAVAVLTDTTGKQAEADALLEKIDVQLVNRKATKSTQSFEGVEMTVYVLPANEDRGELTVVYFTKENILCGVSNLDVAKAIAARFGGAEQGTLADRPAYAETMTRCGAVATELAPDLRWFMAPFAYGDAVRTLAPENEKQTAGQKEFSSILREEGFDAIVGVGGYVNLAVDELKDIVHRTAIYAPPVAAGPTAAQKYTKAMRILELPNREELEVQPWAPRMVAGYTTINIDLLNAFDNVETLVDALVGYQGAYDNVLEGFELDHYGPQINLRNDIIAHLGSRVTMMTDYALPVTVDSQRFLGVFEVTNAGSLRSPLAKWMKTEEGVRKEIDGVAYWELSPEPEVATSADLGGDLLSLDEPTPQEQQENRVLRKAAVCLYEERNQLIVASDVEFLERALFGVQPLEALGESVDFQITMQELAEVAPEARSGWSFFRTDESLRPSYELIRAGKMPESQTFFGRILNEILTTEEDQEQGVVREQRIRGAELPSFELVRRYLGPGARSIRTDEDGWFVTGVVLSKGAE